LDLELPHAATPTNSAEMPASKPIRWVDIMGIRTELRAHRAYRK
jgi:hypothetical protein